MYSRYLDRCPVGPLRFLLVGPLSAQFLSVFSERSFRASEIVILYVTTSDLATIASAPLSALQYCRFGHCQSMTSTVALFPEGCPRLRTLSLDAVNFVPSTGFPSLTHLHMSHPTFFSGPGYSMREFFAFLSGCPNLRTMFFEVPQVGFVARESTHDNLGGLTVQLEHLERLVIVDRHYLNFDPGAEDERMVFLRAFFSHVSTPPSCVVRLGDIPLSDLSNCTALFHFTGNPTSWRVYKGENIPYDSSYTDTMSIQVFNAADGRYLWLDIITASLDPSAVDDGVLELTNVLAESPVFANAREVWIDPGCAWLLSTGQEPLLSHMPNLESLVVRRDVGEPTSLRDSKILQALEPTNWRSGGGGASPDSTSEPRAMACPQLSTLRIDCLTDEDAVYALQLAASRGAAGLPLTRVTLGRTFRGRKKVCMLHQYDGGGEVIRVGSARSDALLDHWMVQLSPICLDDSEDCEPYWRSWRWSSLPK